jgi:hypothetical protein
VGTADADRLRGGALPAAALGTPFRSDNTPIPWVDLRRRRVSGRTTATATPTRCSTASAGP